MKQRILRLNLYLGLVLFLFAVVLLFLQSPFMKTWFYCFAWWSFILFLDSLNFRKHESSPLSESPEVFLFAAFISVFVWLVFELFNLVLKNWSYHDLPSCAFERWLGYFIAYATVIPAIREISFFIRGLIKGKGFALFRFKATPSILRVFVLVGLLFILLGLRWPDLFFPLVWLCFILLLEPLNYWLRNDTLLVDQEKGDWLRIWSWVLAGLVAGFFWEFWNFWAGSHWEYSLPYLNFWRVFQMPVFGYTGFMPFALEVFALYQLLLGLYKKIEKRMSLKVLLFFGLILSYLLCFHLIDTYTLVR